SIGDENEASTSTMGWPTRILCCEVPIQIPIGTVQIDPRMRQERTRRNVRPVPKKSSVQVLMGTWISVYVSRIIPYRTNAENTVRSTRPVQIHRAPQFGLDFMNRRGSILGC